MKQSTESRERSIDERDMAQIVRGDRGLHTSFSQREE